MSQETEVRRGLTWSGKWHIVDEERSARNAYHDFAMCGASLYNDAKEREKTRGNHGLPSHLQDIVVGRSKPRGEPCKICAKKSGVKSVEQLLTDEDMAEKLTKLIFERTTLVGGDANDLAWDVMNAIKDAAGQGL